MVEPGRVRSRAATWAVWGALLVSGSLAASCERDASKAPPATERPGAPEPSTSSPTSAVADAEASRTTAVVPDRDPSPSPPAPDPCSADLDAIAATLDAARVATHRDGVCELTIAPGFGAGVPALAALAGSLEHDHGTLTVYDAAWLEAHGDHTHYDMARNRLFVSSAAVASPDALDESMRDARARARVGGTLRAGAPSLWYGVLSEGEAERDLSDVAVAIDRIDRSLADLEAAAGNPAERAALHARLVARAHALAELATTLGGALAPCAAAFANAEIRQDDTRGGALTARVVTDEATCSIELPGATVDGAVGALHLRLEALRGRLPALAERARDVADGTRGNDWRTGLSGTR